MFLKKSITSNLGTITIFCKIIKLSINTVFLFIYLIIVKNNIRNHKFKLAQFAMMINNRAGQSGDWCSVSVIRDQKPIDSSYIYWLFL